MVRLRRVSPDRPGWTRRRSGKGFVYLDENGRRISDPGQIDRLRGLAVPPAWREVWLCPLANGHLQAVGTDDRGRRQYLYHPQRQELRARAKHARMLDFASRLPAARVRVAEALALPGLPRERVLATAFRLLDVGLFRIGSESYTEANGSYGLATVRKEHVRIQRGVAVFDYTAKSGIQRTVGIADEDLVAVVSALKRRRGGGAELLAWRQDGRWSDVVSADINDYVKQTVSPHSSAKDFRTWRATVLAAMALAEAGTPGSATAARREVTQAMRKVAEHLGNTPTVCRSSYVDPRIIDSFHEGATIRKALQRRESTDWEARVPPQVDEVIERAVLRLLKS